MRRLPTIFRSSNPTPAAIVWVLLIVLARTIRCTRKKRLRRNADTLTSAKLDQGTRSHTGKTRKIYLISLNNLIARHFHHILTSLNGTKSAVLDSNAARATGDADVRNRSTARGANRLEDGEAYAEVAKWLNATGSVRTLVPERNGADRSSTR